MQSEIERQLTGDKDLLWHHPDRQQSRPWPLRNKQSAAAAVKTSSLPFPHTATLSRPRSAFVRISPEVDLHVQALNGKATTKQQQRREKRARAHDRPYVQCVCVCDDC